MRRTQLYLDDDLWTVLHNKARANRTSISELVRQAVREHYLGNLEERRQAMQAFVGIWKDRSELADSAKYVRSLRRGKRLDRINDK